MYHYFSHLLGDVHDWCDVSGLCYTKYKVLRSLVANFGYYPNIKDVVNLLTKLYKPTDLVNNVYEVNKLLWHVDSDELITVKQLRRQVSRLPGNIVLGADGKVNEEKYLRGIENLLGDEKYNEGNPLVQQLIRKDTKLRNEYESALISNLTKKCTPRSDKPVLTIKFLLSAIQKTKLEDAYPEFEFNFTDSEATGHPIAAASRICETASCLRFVNYSSNKFAKAADVYGIGSGKRYDDWVNDVGGNYSYHAVAGNVGVHSCCPRLNSYDATRETLRAMSMTNKLIDEALPPATLINGLNHCGTVVQRCKRTAPYMIGVQSIYDIPLTTLCAAMHNKGTKIMYATMIFDSNILDCDEGTIQDINMHYKVDRKSRTIKFYFEDDTSFGYKHDLDNYLEYITRNNVQLGKDIEFTVEKLKNRLGIMYIRITAITSNYIFNDNLFFALTNQNHKDMITIEYFDWDYSVHKSSNLLRFKKNKTMMPRKLYKDVAGYALTVKDGRFNPSVIMDYLRGISSQVVHTGKSISKFEHESPDNLINWSNAIYFQVYKLRWEVGKITQLLLDKEKHARTVADRSIVGAAALFCYYKVKNLWNKIGSCGDKVRGSLVDAIREPTSKVSKTEYINLIEDCSKLSSHPYEFGSSSIQWYFDINKASTSLGNIINGELLVENVVEVPVHKKFREKCDILDQNTEDDDVEDEEQTRVEDDKSTYVDSETINSKTNWYKASKRIYDKEFFEETGTSVPSIKTKVKQVFVKSNGATKGKISGGMLMSSCNLDKHDVTPNSGNGNCFFFSVLGEDNIVEALNMRRMMLHCPWSSIYSVEQAKEIINMLSDTTASIDDRVIEKFAELFSYRIILHVKSDSGCKQLIFGDALSTPVHILHTTNHFERINLNHDKPKPVSADHIREPIVDIGKSFKLSIIQDSGYEVIDVSSIFFSMRSATAAKRMYCIENVSLVDRLSRKIKPNDYVICPSNLVNEISRSLESWCVTVFHFKSHYMFKCKCVATKNKQSTDWTAELRTLMELQPYKPYIIACDDSKISVANPVAVPDNWFYYDFQQLGESLQVKPVVFDPEKLLRPTSLYVLQSKFGYSIVNEVDPNLPVIFVVPLNRKNDYLNILNRHKNIVIFVERKIIKSYADLKFKMLCFRHRFDEQVMQGFREFQDLVKTLSSKDYIKLVSENQPVFPTDAISNGERKLLEILNHPVLRKLKVQRALDLCSAPGGFVVAIKRKHPGCLLNYHLFEAGDFGVFSCIQKLGVEIELANGDLMNPEIVTSFGNLNDRYDLVTADGRIHDKYDHTTNSILVSNEIYIALKLLRSNGALIVKMFYDKQYEGILDLLTPLFRSVYVIKPENSNVFSSEVYIVAVGFGSMCQDYCDQAKTRFESIIEKTTVVPSDDDGSSVSDLSDIEFNNINVATDDNCTENVALPENKTLKDSGANKDTKQALVSASALSVNDYQPVDSHMEKVFISSKNKFNVMVERNEQKDSVIFMRNALREIAALWECTLPILNETYKRYYAEFGLVDASSDNLKMSTLRKLDAESKNFSLIDVRNGQILYPVKRSKVEYSHGYIDGGFVALDVERDRYGRFKNYVPFRSERFHDKIMLCGPETELMLEESLLKQYHKLISEPIMLPVFDFYHIQGVTGGGKSTLIGTIARPTDLVLTSTLANKESLQEKCPQTRVATLHSYLLNGKNTAEVVIIDEASMRHFGEILLIAVKARPRLIVLVGDVSQLRYFTRIPTASIRFSHHGDVLPVNITFNISHRIPCDVAALFQDIYPEKLMTTNKTVKSLELLKFTGIQDLPKSEHILVFTRAEKATLTESGLNVSTIGEIQGCTYKSVTLVRLNKIPGEKIFSDANQVLVGLTRHTHKLVYVTALDDDYVSNLIKSVNKRSSNELSKFRTKDAQTIIKQKTETVLNTIAGYRTISGGALDYDKFNARPAITTTGFENIDAFMDNSAGNVVSVSYCVKEPGFAPAPVPVSVANVGDGALLQSYFDRIFPLHRAVDMKAATEFVDQNPVLVLNKNVTSIVGRGLSKPKPYDCLRPLLMTNVPAPRQDTQKELLLALDKRNLNIPDIDLDVDQDFVIDVMLERFEDRVIHNRELYKKFKFEPIVLSKDAVVDWLEKQDTKVPSKIKSDCLDIANLERYQLTMKQTVKPQLDLDADKEYNAPQTVVFKEKEFNLFFAPIFKEIKNRLMTVMDSSIQIFTDCSAEEFANKIEKQWPIMFMSDYDTMEIDFKKFDKCQHSLLFKFECEIYRRFGMPQWMLDLWEKAHVHTTLKSFSAGVKTRVNYQRKSGDPVTLLGNTLVSMGMIILMYDFEYATFVGDDVSLFGVDYIDRNEYFSAIFGMESKVFTYKYSYFCSKFLLFINNKVYFLPDPIKLLVKLGRHDLRNFDHVEEYRISTVDLIKSYANPVVVHHLALAVAERYRLNFSVVPMISVLYNFVSDPELFKDLYYKYSTDVEYVGELPAF